MNCGVRYAVLFCGLVCNADITYAMQPLEIEGGRSSRGPRVNCMTRTFGVGVTCAFVVGMGFLGLNLSHFTKDIVTGQCQAHDVEFVYDVYRRKDMCCADLVDHPVKYTMSDSRQVVSKIYVDEEVAPVSPVKIFDREFQRMAVCAEVTEKDAGDDFACYYFTFVDSERLEEEMQAGPIWLQQVLCVRSEEVFTNYLTKYSKRVGSARLTKEEAASILTNQRITVNDFKCSALRHDCNMKACPAGSMYAGAAMCTTLPGSEERGWVVTLTHPIITEIRDKTSGGVYLQTQATEVLNSFVAGITDGNKGNEENLNALCVNRQVQVAE